MDGRRDDDRREIDIRLKIMDQKLDDHGNDLREIRNVLITIAQQAEKLNALTATQNEFRDYLSNLESRVRVGEAFRAACPQKSIQSNIQTLWVFILGMSTAFGAAVIAHVFGGAK